MPQYLRLPRKIAAVAPVLGPIFQAVVVAAAAQQAAAWAGKSISVTPEKGPNSTQAREPSGPGFCSVALSIGSAMMEGLYIATW